MRNFQPSLQVKSKAQTPETHKSSKIKVFIFSLSVPSSYNEKTECRPEHAAIYKRDVEESDKIYFMGWRRSGEPFGSGCNYTRPPRSTMLADEFEPATEVNMILASIQGNGFCAHGDHILKKEHLIRRMDAPELTNSRDITFVMNPEVQEIEDGFFTLLPRLKKLVIKNPECKIRLDSETISLFRKNDVLICGVFDGIAEEIAKEHGLKFLHTEILLGACGELDSPHGCETRTLCFRDNGEAYIRIAENSMTSGGELQYDLPADFYRQDIHCFAQEWGGRFVEETKQNEQLLALLQKAKDKGGCCIDYAKRSAGGSFT